MSVLIRILFLLLYCPLLTAKLVEYSIDINKHYLLNGEIIEGVAFSNQIPGPAIQAFVGDTLRVTYHNRMEEETAIDWWSCPLKPDHTFKTLAA